MTSTHDIIVIGSGIVGLTLAVHLAKHTSLRIAVLDAKPFAASSWSSFLYDPRVYAITPSSQRILESIDAWFLIHSKRVSPFTRLHVWDGAGSGKMNIDHAALHVSVLGHIIEEKVIQSALYDIITTYPQVDFLSPVTLQHLSGQQLLTNDHPFSAKLIIGADGAQSWLREKAGIFLRKKDYQHTAIIAQVQTELPHQQTAWQCFVSGDAALPTGPLAFLPLLDSHHCSIVWSMLPEKAEKILKEDDAVFQKMLTDVFYSRLGRVTVISQRHAFPLYESHVDTYIKEGIALAGDAAHTVHPLAGMGVNLGLADAAYLAQVIIDAVKKGRNFASLPTLRRYERSRKAKNAMMLGVIDQLKTVFTSENKAIQSWRSQGLDTVDRCSALKKCFAEYAMG